MENREEFSFSDSGISAIEEEKGKKIKKSEKKMN